MKKVLLTLIVVMSSVSAFAMSSYRARQEAWFLTDKMAYELYLTEDQMQDVFEYLSPPKLVGKDKKGSDK